MKKRMRQILNLLLLAAVVASAAWWTMRLRQPPAPPPVAAVVPEAPPGATVALFGSRPDATLATGNVSVTGVVVAENPAESVVIVVEAGRPARTLRVGAELASGVRIAEVQRRYVMLSDGVQSARVDIPERALADAAALPGGATEPAPPGNAAATGTAETTGGRGEPPHRSGTAP